MKRVINDIKKIIYLALKVFSSTMLSLSIPIADSINEIFKVFGKSLKLSNIYYDKLYLKVTKFIKRDFTLSLLLYYIIMLISEIYFFVKILAGRIQYYTFESMILYTLLVIVFNTIFIIFLNKHFKSRNFNYIIYLQILFCLPLLFVYWVANIEGSTIELKNLSSDQWISLFNTIIIYFSGCIIGIATLYRTKECKNEKNNK